MNQIIGDIRAELTALAEENLQTSGKGFFKEEIKLYGVRTALVGKVADSAFKRLKELSKTDIFELCETLWQSGYLEESFVACQWAYALRKKFEPDDFRYFDRWVSRYVSNWASCDTLCNHTIGTFIEMYPAFLPELKKWAVSPNRWCRRAAAVSLIIPARNGKFLSESLEIADLLLTDIDDLVQKGYGWLLKAASKPYEEEIFNYVMAHRASMPRTALRYAIEKMPPEMRKTAMAKP